MIERLFLKEFLNFENISLDFDNSLVVLTGPSGAGKSVLISALLSNFGYPIPSYPLLCETTIAKPSPMNSELYELDETLIVKSIKKEKVRYYINDQNIPRKSLEELFAPYVHYLSIRDKKGIDSYGLIKMIDKCVSVPNYSTLLDNLSDTYFELKDAKRELEDIYESESKMTDMIEMATFEVEKIQTINPKIGEDEYLLSVKQQLSKVDKLKGAIDRAEAIFEIEQMVFDVYNLSNKSSEFFSDAMNQLRIDMDEISTHNLELEELNIEEVLNRIEAISGLKNRYGSIQEALSYMEKKRQELNNYEHIEQDKTKLKETIGKKTLLLEKFCNEVSSIRAKELDGFKSRLDKLLEELKLPKVTFELTFGEPTAIGIDKIELFLGDSKISTLSGGEFNRLRLALLVAGAIDSIEKNGIVILDEIDANVSGDESIAIANMLQKLSKNYQIFAISHQPHLASKAHQHILVSRKDDKSVVKALDKEARIEEIARIVDGKEATLEALEFAKKLLN